MTTENDVQPRVSQICARFDTIHWHDSRLVGVHLVSGKDSGDYEIRFEVRFLANAEPGQYQYKNGEVLFLGPRIIQADLDLLGMQYCGGDIAYASCEKESALKEKLESEKLQHFSLLQESEPLADLLHFHIVLIDPGGEISIFARDFEIVSD
jgi:hypothetical protein